MKNILFVVNNEYHLYSSIVMFYKYFNQEAFNFTLLISKRPTNNRIRENYTLPFKYYYLENCFSYRDLWKTKVFPDYEEKLNEIVEKVDELYIYVDFSFLNSLIVNWTKSNPNAKIILVQEGIGGYYKPRKVLMTKKLKFYFVYSFLRYIKNYKKIDFVYQYGRYKKIDEMLMMYPEAVKQKTKANIVKLNLDTTIEINNRVKQIFNLTFSADPSIKYLLYLVLGESNILSNAKEKELDLIDVLYHYSKKHGYKMILKVKSGVDSLIYEKRFGDEISIIKEKIPAEIIISDMYNSAIVSALSSAALHNVNGNKYFWTFPLLGFKSDIQPPTNSIKLLNSEIDLKCIFDQ